MKKVLLGLLVVIVVVVAVFYMVAPASTIARDVVIEADQKAIYRCLTEAKLLQQWWPDSSGTAVTATSKRVQVTDHDLTFTITPRPFNIVDILVQDAGKSVQSFITVAPLLGDTTAVTWRADLSANSPFAKMQNAWRSRKLKQYMAVVLQRLQAFMQSEKNIYGFPVQRTQVTDTLLVVTKQLDTIKPKVATYYGLIKKLRDYIGRLGVQETNYPMLNISKADSTHYQTMVAIPVNKPVPDAGAIVVKRMIPGNILIAEVRGGPGAIAEGMRQMDVYVSEHRFSQPGLPFQSLVTDRLAERDTAKWITKLYYPVQQ